MDYGHRPPNPCPQPNSSPSCSQVPRQPCAPSSIGCLIDGWPCAQAAPGERKLPSLPPSPVGLLDINFSGRVLVCCTSSSPPFLGFFFGARSSLAQRRLLSLCRPPVRVRAVTPRRPLKVYSCLQLCSKLHPLLQHNCVKNLDFWFRIEMMIPSQFLS